MTDPIQQVLITARKNQILDAATAVFAEKGFHRTTIHDIAEHAGIADGTIYNYFDNKTALLLGIFERMRATVLAEEMPSVPVDADLHTLVRTFFFYPLKALEEDEFALYRIVLSEMLVNADLRQLYYEKILEPTLAMADAAFQEQAASRGFHLTQKETQLTIRAISSMVMGLMLSYTIGDEIVKTSWQELPDFLTDLILNGLASTEQQTG